MIDKGSGKRPCLLRQTAVYCAGQHQKIPVTNEAATAIAAPALLPPPDG
ncbi:MAG: hypothetical protein ACLR09_16260 [Gallintestinimicrobium sp.]